MVKFFMNKLKTYHPKEIKAQHNNRFANHLKPDIVFTDSKKNKKIYIDVSLVMPSNSKHMYNFKMNKYKDYTNDIIVPLIFHKNVTINEKTREFLNEYHINAKELYE